MTDAANRWRGHLPAFASMAMGAGFQVSTNDDRTLQVTKGGSTRRVDCRPCPEDANHIWYTMNGTPFADTTRYYPETPQYDHLRITRAFDEAWRKQAS